MKKMNLVTGMLVLTLSAAMLAGCGSGTADTSKTAQTTESVKTTDTESARAAESETVETESVKAAETPAAAESSAAETPKTTESTANAQPLDIASDSGKISVDDARKAALADAGLSESDVVFKRAALETEDGVEIYEVDFYAIDTEFDYDIDPTAAAIIKIETEPMDSEDYTEMEALKGRATGDAAAKTAGITEEAALDIALKDAGLTKSEITSPKATLEYDDDMDRMEYDVEFYVGTTEYSYEIDPDTGEIFALEVDDDD